MDVLQIKAAVRARDGYQCIECGMTQAQHFVCYGKKLDVHRIVPGSEYSVKPGVCETLCRRCHGSKPRRPKGSSGRPPLLNVEIDAVVKMAIKLRILRSPGRPTISKLVNSILHERLTEELSLLVPPPAPEEP